MSLASFGMIAEPLLLDLEKCLADALVNKDAETPKSHLPPVEVRMLFSATDGLLSASTASITMSAIFPRPPLSWSICEAKMRTSRTNLNQLAPSCWRKVIETKSGQTLVFGPGGCTCRQRACPFLGGRRALIRGGFVWDAAMVSETEALFVGRRTSTSFSNRRTSDFVRRTLLLR